MSDTMIMISSIGTAIATIAIAVFSWRSYCLSEQIKKVAEDQNKREEEFKSHIKDLFQAIVVSNILSGPSSYGSLDQAIEAFNCKYKGKLRIFN